MKRKLAAVVAAILALVAAAFYIHTQNTHRRAPLAFAIIAAAVITFFWFVAGASTSGGDPARDERVMRKAIAASIVMEYMVLVGTYAFWGEGSAPLPPMTALLIPNFTNIVGVVIAFYFGASAFVEAKARAGSNANDIEKGSEGADSPLHRRAQPTRGA